MTIAVGRVDDVETKSPTFIRLSTCDDDSTMIGWANQQAPLPAKVLASATARAVLVFRICRRAGHAQPRSRTDVALDELRTAVALCRPL
jgi:hypothetical protein